VCLQICQQPSLKPLDLGAVIGVIQLVIKVFPAHHRSPAPPLLIASICFAYNCSAQSETLVLVRAASTVSA
jgi:hypothetical protein